MLRYCLYYSRWENELLYLSSNLYSRWTFPPVSLSHKKIQIQYQTQIIPENFTY